MTVTTIRFYFDYESPNAYLAWTQLPSLADKYGSDDRAGSRPLRWPAQCSRAARTWGDTR